MSRRVRIVATATTPFRKRFDGSVDALGALAVRSLLQTSGLDPAHVDEAYVGTSKGGSLIGQRALRFAGLATGLPIVNVENACASSATAFHLAHRSVASGAVESALVLGVDQLSTLGSGALPVQDTEWDGTAGITNPVVYAMRAQRYLHETGASVEDLAAVSVKSRRFASLNPNAQMRVPTTVEEVLASRPVADPLTLFQCSAKSDGAAALVVMSDERARALGLDGPVVRATALASGAFSMAPRDVVRPDITLRASAAAFEQAGLGPADLDVVELHDAFSIAELLYTEELGLCEDGAGAAHVTSGASSSLDAGASALVNPSGGLLSRGHPIGATGAAQLVELVTQLEGRAGARQRQDARVALAHVTGGGASGFDNGACCVTVLTRD